MTYTIELPNGTVVKGDDHTKVIQMAHAMNEAEDLELEPCLGDLPTSSRNEKSPKEIGKDQVP
ncbi:MAG: hypothetical protein ABEH81_00865 [Halopenitus sp.]